VQFLFPVLLFGVAGAIVPLIVHWLHRRRARHLAWGAMQFLRAGSAQTRRRRKIEQWVLLAVRMLVVAAFAAMLAGPTIRGGRVVPAFTPGPPVDVAVVIDHSVSTGRSSGGKTVFSRGVELADGIIRSLGDGDMVCVLLAEHTPRALAPRLIGRADAQANPRLQDALHHQPPGSTDCSIPDAVAAAGQLLQSGGNPRKLILILSDHQRLKWHAQDEAVWESAVAAAGDAQIVSIPIIPDQDFANAAVQEISVQPRLISAGRPFQIHARIANTGTKPLGGFSVRLSIDGRDVATKTTDPLAAGATATVRVELQNGIGATGSHIATATIDMNDALPAENSASTAVNVLPALPILIIDGQFSDAGEFAASRFLSAAIEPEKTSPFKPRLVALGNAINENLNAYAAVVLNDWPSIPPPLRDRLTEYAQSGHGVWCILGPRTRESLIRSDLAAAGLLNANEARFENAGATPVVRDPAHPILAAVAGTEQNAFAGAQIRQLWSLRPIDPDVQMPLATAGGAPLILTRPIGSAGGPFVLWTTSVDGAWNNFHLMPNFVPLVNETIDHLVAPLLYGRESHELLAGQPIEWTGDGTVSPGSVRVTLPDNTQVERQPTLVSGRWMLTFPDTYQPGVYRVEFANTSIPPVQFALNIDPKTLARMALNREDISWLAAHHALDSRRPLIAPNELIATLRSPAVRLPVWGLLGGLVLASLVVETWLAGRMIRRAVSPRVENLFRPSSRPSLARRIA
jgi:hypothetical protein